MTAALTPISVASTAEQVADFVAGIGEAFGKYRAAIVSNGLNGKVLLKVGADPVILQKWLGVENLIHATRIASEVEDLKLRC